MTMDYDIIQSEFSTHADIQLDAFQLELANEVLEQLSTLGQSGLEVMTSGGKSYIAAYIMSMYTDINRDGKILWIAPKSAVNNVKNKILCKLAMRNRVEYIGYEELARGNVELTDKNDVKLIVFDECHKAYAKKTYEGLQSILEGLEDADRLAMSATPVRYGGINTFNILVPKVTNPIQFDLKDAAEHDLLPKVVYVLANMNISASDFKVLEQFKDMVKNNVEAESLYREVLETLSSFQFNLKDDLGELLVRNIGSDGSTGERHIAFFSSIASLKNMKESVKAAFKESYPNCEINVLEYHSGLSDTENEVTFKQFVIEEPQPYRIDVMLSVDKATESIHPDNVRSVLLFRGTQSVRVYLQQMGRGIMLKSYHPEDIVIFDFADNIDICTNAQTIGIGYTNVNKPIGNNTKYEDTIEGIKRAIMSQFGYTKGLTAGYGLTRINECVEKLRRLHTNLNIREMYKQITLMRNGYKYIIKKDIGYQETNNLYRVIDILNNEIDEGIEIKPTQFWKDCTTSEEFKCRTMQIEDEFKTYQDIFLSDEKQLSPLLRQVFKKLGYMAYLRKGNGRVSEALLEDIDYISKEIKKCGGLDNSQNTHAKHKLKELRLAYAKKMVPYNICVYAKRIGIDIEMKHIDIAGISSLCDTEADREIMAEFKGVIKALDKIDNCISNGENITYDDWLSSNVKLLIAYRKYRDSEMACICMSYIYSKYEYILNMFKLKQKQVEDGAKLLSAIMKIRNNELPNKAEEDYIFEHSKMVDMSEYEIKMLKEFDITVNKYTSELEDKTDFVVSYNRAIEGSEEDIKKMIGYNRDLLDDRRKKMLNTNMFKQIKEETKGTVGIEVLLKQARNMFGDSSEYKKLRKEISEALGKGLVTPMDIALAPFREDELVEARAVIEMSESEFGDCASNLTIVTPLNIIITRCSQPSRCTIEMIDNVIRIRALDDNIKNRLRQINSLIVKYKHLQSGGK